MFARYKMTPIRWLGLFLAILFVPGLVLLAFAGPVIAVLGVSGAWQDEGMSTVQVLLAAVGFGMMIGLPLALVGCALCALSSRVLGYFSFPQIFVIGMVVAWPLAHGLTNKAPETLAPMMVITALAIIIVWLALRWLGLFPPPIQQSVE
jgi:hypothetical protein